MFAGLEQYETGAQASAGAWLTLKSPRTGEDLDMRVRILGGDSDKWRSIEDGLQKEQARHAARTKGDTDWRYEDKLLVQAIADAILDWDGFVDELDEAIPCENDNKLLLLTTHRWVFEQINGVIKDRTRFMPGGEQS